MTFPWVFLWLMPRLEPGIAIGWGVAALAILGLLLLALRLRQASIARHGLATKVETLSRELETSRRTLQEALTAIENENFTDPLTELYNRRYISAVIKADAAKAQRVYRDAGPALQANQDLVFLMVDLDHFSLINEFYGASVGDQVLVTVARVLRQIVRESDAVIRWGGEEFLVVARNTNRGEAPELAERIRSVMACQAIDTPKGEILRWTCSVGFAAFPFQTSDLSWMGWDRVVELTDACLDVAKKSGRNAWVGLLPKAGLERAKHGTRLPKEVSLLVDEGVLEVFSSREDPFGKTKKVGEILG